MGTKISKIRITIQKNRPYYFTIITFIVGVLLWSLTMVRNGLNYPYGVGFWGANGHDGIWHIALAESLSRGSLDNPVFSGFALKNYHLGFDLLLALLNKITSIPISILYFQILPIIFSILIGILVYKFVYEWRRSTNESLWALFFVFFGSSFGFVVTYLRDRVITGESMFWSSQSSSTLINPPFALSLIFILWGLLFLIKYLKNSSIKYFILIALMFGLLIQIKVYAGLLVLGGLFLVAIYNITFKRSPKILYLFLSSILISILLFIPFNKEASNSIQWQPFWFLETLMSYSDRLGWEKFYSAMTTYKMGKIWLKGIIFYGISFIIFIIGNMGLRIIGFDFVVRILKRKEKINDVMIFIFSILIAAILIPMFFVQRGTPWNTIQFFYYYLFFFSILAGISMSLLLEKLKYVFRRFLIIFILLFTILGVWSTMQHYLPLMPQAKISTLEMEALDFLKDQPQGVVLTYPFDAIMAKQAESNPPRPLFLYESTAYVSAFSQKDVFLEDEVNLNIMGYDWKKRRQDVLDWYEESDEKKARQFLKDNNIAYVYWLKNLPGNTYQHAYLGDSQLGLTKIFENKEVTIFSNK